MKFPELLFYSWRWNGKVELEGFLTYMSHVKSRIVYKLPDGRVVKLALPRVGSANLDEVVLACQFGGLFPKLLSHGVAGCGGEDACVVEYLVMEELKPLSVVLKNRPASVQFEWLGKAALYMLELARAGVIGSDCELEDLGVRGGEVLAFHFWSFSVQDGPVDKGKLGGFERFLDASGVCQAVVQTVSYTHLTLPTKRIV